MKNEIDTNDIFWEMDWGDTRPDGTRVFPNKPEKEIMFDVEMALAHLLMNSVIFTNSSWWEKNYTEEQKTYISIAVNCNDVFAWGCADAETLPYDDIRDLYEHWIKDQNWGPAVWCIKKRNYMPQKPVYRSIMAAGIWNLDEMELETNMDSKKE